MTNKHEGPNGIGCPGSYTPFYFDIVKGKSVLKFKDYKEYCDCDCHKEE